jgi:signal transduction histidine kinase
MRGETVTGLVCNTMPQINLPETLFDHMPMGIAIFDRDLVLRRCNPTWADFIERYTPTSRNQVVPGANFFDLIPGIEVAALPLIERALAGDTVRQEALRVEINAVISYWDVILAPIFENGQVVGTVNVLIDATERVLAYQMLGQQVEERTRELKWRMRELEALYRADQELHRYLRLDQVLQALVDIAVDILQADKSSLVVWDPQRERLVVRAARGFSPETVAQMSFALGEGVVGRVAASGEPMVVVDTLTNSRMAGHVAEPEEIRSFMHVPIKIGEQVFGVFNVNYVTPRAFSGDDQRLFLALAQQAALAIENARLYEETRQRLAESQSLQRVTTALLQKISLDEVLKIVCTEAQRLTGAMRSSVFLLEDDRWLRVAFTTGAAVPTFERMPIEGSLTGMAVRRCEPVLSNNPEKDARGYPGDVEPSALLAVPLCVKGVAMGALVVVNKPGGFRQEDVRIIKPFVDQAATAIENARLYEQGQELAAVRERQRLARDLHDAVTQTLFSASLIAEVLPRLWEHNPKEGRRRLAELRELARGALAEMRTLLLELQPATLTETGLGDLLRQLAESIIGRARVPIKLEANGEWEPPAAVKVALYRIAQEALNNVAKHANATQAVVSLHCQPGEVVLRVSDDGLGFDPENVSPEHLGLGIMRERAEAISATLTIESQPGHGTRVVVVWSDERRTTDDQ